MSSLPLPHLREALCLVRQSAWSLLEPLLPSPPNPGRQFSRTTWAESLEIVTVTGIRAAIVNAIGIKQESDFRSSPLHC